MQMTFEGKIESGMKVKSSDRLTVVAATGLTTALVIHCVGGLESFLEKERVRQLLFARL